jgi:hypothetical protein
MAKCKAILNDLFSPIEAKMKEVYITSGGFNLLRPEVDKLKMVYLEKSLMEEFGPCKGLVLKEFEDEKVIWGRYRFGSFRRLIAQINGNIFGYFLLKQIYYIFT